MQLPEERPACFLPVEKDSSSSSSGSSSSSWKDITSTNIRRYGRVALSLSACLPVCYQVVPSVIMNIVRLLSYEYQVPVPGTS